MSETASFKALLDERMSVANEPIQEMLVFRDGSSATIHVTHLGSDRFRIDDTLIALAFPALRFGDIIMATRNAQGSLVVGRRVEKSGFRAYEYVLSEGWHERESVQGVLDKVLSLGGNWDGVFGGILIICMPPTTDYDPSKDIASAMGRFVRRPIERGRWSRFASALISHLRPRRW